MTNNLAPEAIQATDSHKIALRTWQPANSKKSVGLVVIAHGLAEHIDRYDELARHLSAEGFTVAGANHRGHGQGAADAGELGKLPENGWNLMVEDLNCVLTHIKSHHPALPLFLLGHSMGTFIATRLVQRYGQQLDGLILSAPNYSPPAQYSVLKQIARLERWRQGPDGCSKLIDKLAFGAFNKPFAPNRTDFDWLSRDENRVDSYCQDPLCGTLSSNQLWFELMQGFSETYQKQSFSGIPARLPIYLMHGSRDPISNGGKGVATLATMLKRAGVAQVDKQAYADGRHEMFNETNRTDVYADLVAWLRKALPGQ